MLENKPFASGGEGELYQVISSKTWGHCVAKIIYSHKRTAEKEAKLYNLLDHPPLQEHSGKDASIIWVQELLHDQEGNFVGFLMPRATGEKLEILTAPKLPKYLGPEWNRLRLGSPPALRLRLKVCYNIALAVYWLHASNRYVLVDLKPDNILVRSNGTVSIVDIDSVEIVEGKQTLFAATVATPEYTPSEYYQGTRPGKATIDSSWDHFSLAVIVYRLLFGIHPFAATSSAPYDQLTSLGDKIKTGLFVHNTKHQATFRVIPPPHQIFKQQEEALQVLFKQAFVAGHEQPEKRPNALTWTKVIANHPLLLTNRALPSTRLSLQSLEHKNWYKAAVEQTRQSQLPVITNKTQRHYLTTIRKPFKQKLEENLVQLWDFCRKAAIAIGVSYVLVFILLVVAAFTGGIEDDWQLITQFLGSSWQLLYWFLKSPFFLLFIFSPLIRAVFTQAKETFLFNGNRDEERAARQTQKVIEEKTKDPQERQYKLYTERSRLNNKLRELKNEFYVYQKVKQQKETDFGEAYQASIARTNKKIEEELSAKKATLFKKDKEANRLIQEEAEAIRVLMKTQQHVLAVDPVFGTIRGKNSAQKLLFLKNDPSSWEDTKLSKATVYKALQQKHQEQKQAQEQLKKQYDAAHQFLLEAVEEEKVTIDALVGSAVQAMRARLRMDDLLFDQAFLKTLISMEALQAEIKQREKNLEKVNLHLKKVKAELKGGS